MGGRSAGLVAARYQTMQQIVYDDLVQAIRRGARRPGQVVASEVIAAERGCSRTPVREALRRLQTEGYVVMQPHQRAVVAQFSERALREIYDVRRLLEPYAARLAAQLATDKELRAARALFDRMAKSAGRARQDATFDLNEQFHEALYLGAHHGQLLATILQLRRSSEPYRRVYASLPGHGQRMVDSRRELLEACEARDHDRSEGLVKALLTRNEDELVANLRRTEQTERNEG